MPPTDVDIADDNAGAVEVAEVVVAVAPVEVAEEVVAAAVDNHVRLATTVASLAILSPTVGRPAEEPKTRAMSNKMTIHRS